MDLDKTRCTRSRWRLCDRHFNGPGDYTLTMGERSIVVSVDADRVFEAKDEEVFPFYGFAAIIGSHRDVVTPTGLGFGDAASPAANDNSAQARGFT